MHTTSGFKSACTAVVAPVGLKFWQSSPKPPIPALFITLFKTLDMELADNAAYGHVKARNTGASFHLTSFAVLCKYDCMAFTGHNFCSPDGCMNTCAPSLS